MFSSNDPTYDLDGADVYNQCNADCNCTTESYDPVCGSDGTEYFTPCFAGCTDVNDDDDVIVALRFCCTSLTCNNI